jgi:hypothetical protein
MAITFTSEGASMSTLASASQITVPPIDDAAVEPRRTLQARLAQGEFQTLAERVYDAIGRFVAKLTGGQIKLVYWASAFVAILVHLLLVCALSILDGVAVFRDNFVLVVSAGVLAQLGLLIYTSQYHALFIVLRDHVVNAMLSASDLADLEQWLVSAASTRACLATSLLVGLLPGLYLGSSFVFLRGEGGIGTILATGLQGLVFGMVFYYFILFVILPLRIGQYELNLYAIKPSSSELVVRVAQFFSHAVLLLGLYGALITLLFAYVGVALITAIALVCVWAPLIGLFTASQNALSRIIADAKLKTLTRLQTMIEELQEADDFGSPEQLAKINRLMDFHDRIEATRGSALNVRSVLDFVNSLLLPLLAFILANLERIRAWLG